MQIPQFLFNVSELQTGNPFKLVSQLAVNGGKKTGAATSASSILKANGILSQSALLSSASPSKLAQNNVSRG